MSAFGIAARFPFGTYQGHAAGVVEPYPDTARLFDALTHAAGTGLSAVENGGDLHPAPASVAALTWLEEHPPGSIHLPDAAPTRGTTFAYRADGVFDKAKKGGRLSDRKTARSIGGAALAGRIGWIWDEPPPPDVRDTVARLVEDVAYLGEAECPVVLDLDVLEPTHRLARDRSPFDGIDGIFVRTPVAGRLAALERAYSQRYPTKRPTAAADRFSEGQRPIAPEQVMTGSEQMAYESVRETPVPAPWGEVFLLPVVTEHGEVPEFRPHERVAWAVAIHRALVAQPALAYTASPLVTGRYPKHVVARHANRVAIHLLTPEAMAARDPGETRACVAVMIPPEITPTERALVAEALTSLRRIYAGRLGVLRALPGEVVDATRFWAPARAGAIRWWRTSPVAVPEVRRQTDPDGRRWTLADAARLSLAFVLRDILDLPDVRGADGYRRLRDDIAGRGIRVLEARAIREGTTDYVHRLPAGVVAQPYTATVDTAGVLPTRALVAIGQSRHLGGGLLRPLDVPVDLAREWDLEGSWTR